MKRILVVGAALAAWAAAWSALSEPPPVRGGTITVPRTSLEAEVVRVNLPRRRLVVRDRLGREFALRVPDDVDGLHALEKGDGVDVVFLRGAALAFGTRATPPAEADAPVRLAPPDGAPVGGVLDARNVAGTISELDDATGELTLSAVDGSLHLLHAAEEAPGLDAAGVGDFVVVRITDAVALELEER